jgi:5-hydroxyisourate hydrolase
MSASASLSTHVLDTQSGRPASGLRVALHRIERDRAVPVAERSTDADGRVRELGADLAPGTYRLTFDVGGYFAEHRGIFSVISVDLVLASGHHHVPLLVSPFACVSYRGS